MYIYLYVGAEAVGKSFILTRFVGDDKDHNKQKYEPTVGADLRIAGMLENIHILLVNITHQIDRAYFHLTIFTTVSLSC
jgi:GTPase SAR1 family protein